VRSRFAIALGSNRRHVRFGSPEAIIRAALTRLDRKKVHVIAASRTVRSRPLGPSRRTYANAAALIETRFEPHRLLKRLKKIEREFGRRPGGSRWSARTLDLDILLWSRGSWASQGLVVPHREFRKRSFVLDPLATIAGEWRDPLSGLTVRQLKARLDRKRPAA
jgi:2-amino-4-hydroxy-6-hydroxymethyldihydropteridine diphosphokinase